MNRDGWPAGLNDPLMFDIPFVSFRAVVNPAAGRPWLVTGMRWTGDHSLVATCVENFPWR